MEKRQTAIDVFNETGNAGIFLVLLFLSLLVYGMVILFRRLDQGWRKSFLIVSFLPLVIGAGAFCHRSIEDIYWMDQGAARMSGQASSVLYWLLESITIIRLGAWLTIILLVFSAFLFIAGKDKERRISGVPEAEREDSSNSRAI